MISRLARNEAFLRLRSAWQTKLAAVIATGDYATVPTADQQALQQIDWTNTRQKQVFQGQVDIASLEATSPVKWPLVILYASDLSHDGAEKFVMFSGSVAVNLEFHYTWPQSKALPNFDDFMDLIEETVVNVFHDRQWVGALSGGLQYRGEMTAQRGPVQESSTSGKNWTQSIAFRMVFGVDV